MPVNVIIGGTIHRLPPVNFVAIEAAYPSIEAFATAKNLLAQVSLVIEIISHIFVEAEESQPGMTPEAIKRQLKGCEMTPLIELLPAILAETGLVQQGEALPAVASSGSNGSKS